jgi:hypothetical protein
MPAISTFHYAEDGRIVLVFDTPAHAEAFKASFSGKGRADIFQNPAHVFLSPPKKLHLVRPGPVVGTIAYVFADADSAQAWAKDLEGEGLVKEGENAVVVPSSLAV